MHPPSLFPSQYVFGSSTYLPLNYLPPDHSNLDHHPSQSWSQFLLGGLSSQEDGFGTVTHFQPKISRLENWEEEQILIPQYPRDPHHQSHHHHHHHDAVVDFIKQEAANNSHNSINLCMNPINNEDEDFHQHRHKNHNLQQQQEVGVAQSSSSSSSRAFWSPVQMMPLSSPRSCVTSLSNNNNNNMLDFSYNNETRNKRNHQHADNSAECNSTATGGMSKKARVHPSLSQPPLKVRKEKLGDRITALHQLVSPFGKTDTASVLLEAIGYIRFLQGQIEALSSPYLGNASKNIRNQHSLLNDKYCQKRKGAPIFQQADSSQEHKAAKDLRSKGLCLVPVSCTQHVGSDNGADYWAPAYESGF